MSRRKPLRLSTLRASVTKLIRAARAHAFKGAAHPGDVPSIEAEYNEAWDALDRQLQRVMDERAELVEALNVAIICAHGAGGLDPLIAIAAKYEVKL